ncbi:hypothetical protein ACWEF9_09360 [Streptomyces sp. NPDC004980]
MESEVVERIAARRAELDELEEQLAKQLSEVRGKLESLRGKLTKLADRGWLRKRPDGRFTVPP